MNSHLLTKILIGAGVLAAPAIIFAAPPEPQRIVCPVELPDDALRIGATTDGWIPYKSFPLRLNSAAPTRGRPEELADLATFTTVKTKTSRIDTYPLPLPHPGGIWMKCGYGSLNEITLHKQLDERIRECRITTSNAEPPTIDIICR